MWNFLLAKINVSRVFKKYYPSSTYRIKSSHAVIPWKTRQKLRRLSSPSTSPCMECGLHRSTVQIDGPTTHYFETWDYCLPVSSHWQRNDFFFQPFMASDVAENPNLTMNTFLGSLTNLTSYLLSL